jgi:hypothetical protein
MFPENRPISNSGANIRFAFTTGQKSAPRIERNISLEELRKVLGLESINDAEGNVIEEAPLQLWANFRQRALDVEILEINAKTDLKIKLLSIERSKHRRVVALLFMIRTQPIPKGATRLLPPYKRNRPSAREYRSASAKENNQPKDASN